MRTDGTSAASAIFAANRARGSVIFDVHQVEGLTRRRHLHESGSLRVRFPSPEADGLSAVFVNTAGGVAGGDRFGIDIAAGEGSRLTVTTAAAEKVYRAQGPAAQLDIALEGGRGRASVLAAAGDHPVRPGAGVAADRHRPGRQRLAAALRNRGVRPRRDGRAHAGRRIRRPLAALRRGGRLVFAENIRLDGDIGEKLAQPAVAKGGVAIGTALIVPGDEALVERIRELPHPSAARSASPAGTGLQWRVSVPKMRRGFAPT